MTTAVAPQLDHSIELIGAIIFIIAVAHTFAVKLFQSWAHRFPEGSIGENLMHLLGEVEVVFGLWSFIFFCVLALQNSTETAKSYINSRDFTEPLFVFTIMVVASTKPIITLASRLINTIARQLPFAKGISFYATCLILGPILGSFITEPAAMTVTAIILLERFFQQRVSTGFKYATLGLLFVNISIGGTLTNFAAPPVVMVAGRWHWDTAFMFVHFGWKAILAITISTIAVIFQFRGEIKNLPIQYQSKSDSPLLMSGLHVLFLALIVINSHEPKLFISILLFFLGFATVTREYQSPLKIREGLLVGFFLGGLVTLGGVQSWWVNEFVVKLQAGTLYIASSALTAIFDNAALTYLGSLVPDITEASKYALVAGSVVGGGLTVIANAPNPIGYGLLNSRFGKEGINPLLLARAALMPTMIAGFCFWFL